MTSIFTLSAVNFSKYLSPESLGTYLRVLIIAGVAFPLLLFLSRLVGSIIKKRISEHIGLVTRKVIFYIGVVLLTITLLLELGFNLTAALGAAGVATLAIGFAAQTSLSNVISGIFLYVEKPFEVGDLIRISDTTAGFVLSIDLMSVKIRTFDNLFVRIPNETLIKAQVTNITRFPIRRLDINIGVAYKEDVARVIQVLKEIADTNPYSLDEPEPLIIFKDFGESSLNFMVGLWFEKSQFLLLKNSIMRDIKERLDSEGIEIPFPHRTFYTGSVTEPLPIRMVGDTLPETKV